jgi:hypothetical protein
VFKAIAFALQTDKHHKHLYQILLKENPCTYEQVSHETCPSLKCHIALLGIQLEEVLTTLLAVVGVDKLM